LTNVCFTFTENEETPAISDNANSLKFPHHNPDGFDEALFSKKKSHHLANNVEEMGLDFDLDNKARAKNFQIDYTPQDIAEYIFWTGDERGVASAIGDFLQEGMVSIINQELLLHYQKIKEKVDQYITMINELSISKIISRNLS
jgi:hypothetical protein